MSDEWHPWLDGGGPDQPPTGPGPEPGNPEPGVPAPTVPGAGPDRPPDWPDPSIYLPLPSQDGATFSGAIVDNLDDVARFLRSTASGLVADVETIARSIETAHWLGPRAWTVRGLVERQVLPALRDLNDRFVETADVLVHNAAQQREASAIATTPASGVDVRPGPAPWRELA